MLRDLRYAMRALARTPGFTLGVVLTLALGIGVNAAVFGVVDALFLRPPTGVRDADGVVRLYVRRADPFFGTGVGGIGVYPAFAALRDAQVFDRIAAVNVGNLSLGRGSEARQVQAAAVSAAYFPLLGVTPARGRFFGPGDDRPGAERTVVLTDAFARAHFAADSAAIGRSLLLGGHVYTVIGVASHGFTGIDLEPVQLFLPIEAAADEFTDPKALTSWNYWWMDVIARTPARRDAAVLAAHASAVYRRGISAARQRDSTSQVLLGPIQEARGPRASQESRVSAWIGTVAVAVLLIACANVANLLLARGTARRRELALRAGLGAGRGGLVRMMLAESLALAMAGGIAAVVLAAWAGAAVRAFFVPDLPADTPIIDVRLLGVSALAVALTTGLIGIVPALQLSRTDLTEALKSGGLGATVGGGRTRASLLVVQTALTLVLLVGAGLFVRSLRNVQHVDLGFDPDRVLEARVDMGDAGLEGPAANAEYLRLLDRIRRLPGVSHAAATMSMFGWGFAVTITAEGRDSIPRLPTGGPYLNVVTPDYFAALGTRLVRGRLFTDGDDMGAPRVGVVNETMARVLWPRDGAIDRCLYIGSDTTTTCTRVVGVVADAKRGQVTETASMLYYLPYAQGTAVWPGGTSIGGLVVRSRGPADEVTGAVQREMQAGGNLPYASVRSLADRIAPQFRSWRLGAGAFTMFGVLALLIAAMGIFGVMSYSVTRRTQEIGIRMALGAEAAHVARMVLGQGLRTVAMGVLVGGAGAWALGRGVRALLYEVAPADPLVFGSVATLLVAVAAAAAWLPARRAARVDPMTALRSE